MCVCVCVATAVCTYVLSWHRHIRTEKCRISESTLRASGCLEKLVGRNGDEGRKGYEARNTALFPLLILCVCIDTTHLSVRTASKLTRARSSCVRWQIVHKTTLRTSIRPRIIVVFVYSFG